MYILRFLLYTVYEIVASLGITVLQEAVMFVLLLLLVDTYAQQDEKYS